MYFYFKLFRATHHLEWKPSHYKILKYNCRTDCVTQPDRCQYEVYWSLDFTLLLFSIIPELLQIRIQFSQTQIAHGTIFVLLTLSPFWSCLSGLIILLIATVTALQDLLKFLFLSLTFLTLTSHDLDFYNQSLQSTRLLIHLYS